MCGAGIDLFCPDEGCLQKTLGRHLVCARRFKLCHGSQSGRTSRLRDPASLLEGSRSAHELLGAGIVALAHLLDRLGGAAHTDAVLAGWDDGFFCAGSSSVPEQSKVKQIALMVRLGLDRFAIAIANSPFLDDISLE